jgi:hypothetical protein
VRMATLTIFPGTNTFTATLSAQALWNCVIKDPAAKPLTGVSTFSQRRSR